MNNSKEELSKKIKDFQSNQESLKQRDLYFLGECLDITGELGGFNFQIAFSEAFVCARELNKDV